MTELIEIIKGRRSIQKYEMRDVSDEVVNQVLEAIGYYRDLTSTKL